MSPRFPLLTSLLNIPVADLVIHDHIMCTSSTLLIRARIAVYLQSASAGLQPVSMSLVLKTLLPSLVSKTLSLSLVSKTLSLSYVSMTPSTPMLLVSPSVSLGLQIPFMLPVSEKLSMSMLCMLVKPSVSVVLQMPFVSSVCQYMPMSCLDIGGATPVCVHLTDHSCGVSPILISISPMCCQCVADAGMMYQHTRDKHLVLYTQYLLNQLWPMSSTMYVCHWSTRLLLPYKPCNYDLPLLFLFHMIFPSHSQHPSVQVLMTGFHMQQNSMRQHDFHAACFKLTDPLHIARCRHLLCGTVISAGLFNLQSQGYMLPAELSLGFCIIVSRLHSLVHQISIEHMITLFCSPSCECIKTTAVLYSPRFSGGLTCIPQQKFQGGGHASVIQWSDIKAHAQRAPEVYRDADVFTYVDYLHEMTAVSYSVSKNFVVADVPLSELIPHVSVATALKIARLHDIPLGSHVPKKHLLPHFQDHKCMKCASYLSVFKLKTSVTTKKQTPDPVVVDTNSCIAEPFSYPPSPASDDLTHKVIGDFCKESAPNVFEEGGCAVCGQLTPVSELSSLKSVKNLLHILATPGVTRIERKVSHDCVCEFKGPVLDYGCNSICAKCRAKIRKGEIPEYALANGLWLGKVPKVLSDLRFIEKLVIARLRHNCCFVKVA
jgi:hypothetical protein